MARCRRCPSGVRGVRREPGLLGTRDRWNCHWDGVGVSGAGATQPGSASPARDSHPGSAHPGSASPGQPARVSQPGSASPSRLTAVTALSPPPRCTEGMAWHSSAPPHLLSSSAALKSPQIPQLPHNTDTQTGFQSS